MTRSKKKAKKLKLSNTKPTKKILKKQPPHHPSKKPDYLPPESEFQSDSPDSESASDSYSEPEDLISLLQPYTKEQLMVFISTAAADDPALYDRVIEMADRDVSHRKVFVHGLGWDTTRDAVVSAFSSSSDDIEECKLVTDKATGKSKGYAFVLFRTRKAAARALKTPQRRINNRMVSCQLASVGPAAGPSSSVGERKIYVSNVQRDVDKESLRSFFEQFGEIETGPIGFDINTGKSRGFAIFVYRTVEAARRVLEQPHKLFQGQQLHCQKATDSKNRSNASSSSNIDSDGNVNSNVVGNSQVSLQGLAAVAAAQNLALFGQQHPPVVMNPAVYGAGLINPVMASMGGLGGVDSSMLGAYGTAQGLPPVYPNASVRKQGTPGSFTGHSSYMWYDLLLFLFGFYLLVFVNSRWLCMFSFDCLCCGNVYWFSVECSKFLTCCPLVVQP